MKAYRTSSYNAKIEEHEIERWTASTVVKAGGRREHINSSFHHYHETRSEAVNAVRNRLYSELDAAKRRVANAESTLHAFIAAEGEGE